MQHLKLRKVGLNLGIINPPKKIPFIKRTPDERKIIGQNIILKKETIIKELSELNAEYEGLIRQALVFKIKINRLVNVKDIDSMGLKILRVEGNHAIIVYSSDDHATAFTDKINQYRGLVEGYKYPFLDAFDDLESVLPDEKKGRRLREEPLMEGDANLLDIEFWPCDKEQLISWASELEEFIRLEGGFVLRRYAEDSYCFIRAFIPCGILAKILAISQVSRIDRIPKRTLQMEKIGRYSLSDFEAKVEPPKENDLGILIIDSGIMPNHPFLKEAVREFESFVPEEDGIDKCRHGTCVAGVALYGDLNQSIENGFQPDAWLYSAKVCESKKDGYYDEENIKKSIEYFISNYEDIKIINISLGNDDDETKSDHRQFYLAAMIDQMIYKYRVLEGREIIFIISSGNAFRVLEKNPELLNRYPNYLIDNIDFKIIDPGTSANALTVGSVSRGEASVSKKEKVVAGYMGFPSPFTRSGPCLKGMVKPEIVDIGGDMLIPGESIKNEQTLGVLVTENDFIKNGLISVDSGTSLSCAKITNLVAKLWNRYPDYSSEMIKALVVNSARIPPIQSPSPQMKLSQEFERPKILESLADAMNIYGYGIPCYERALPEMNRVLLLDQSEIELNKLMIYEIVVPSEFYEAKGPREISITLSFVPPTDAGNVKSYFGCTMEFELFRNISLNDLKLALSSIENSDDLENIELTFIPKKYLSKYKTPLRPTITKRSNSSVQKAMWLMENPRTKSEILYLVVICRDKWMADHFYKQPYAIIVTIEHSNEGIDLYTQIETSVASLEGITPLSEIPIAEKA